jgi:hypothetical protein
MVSADPEALRPVTLKMLSTFVGDCVTFVRTVLYG